MESNTRRELTPQTAIGWSTADDIYVRGYNLSRDLIGKIDLTDMTYLLVRGRLPEQHERTMLTALMVTIVEHGITPSVIAARMTYLGAPEALQGSVAAGLLGAGNVYLGAMEATGNMLVDALKSDRSDLDALAADVVADFRARKAIVPGIGHPIHTGGDPRVGRLFSIAGETGFMGRYIRLLEAIADKAGKARGRLLPINAAGAIGAIGVEMGFDWRVVKGFALIARTIGLVGHLSEEMQQPIASRLWTEAEHLIEHPSPREGAD